MVRWPDSLLKRVATRLYDPSAGTTLREAAEKAVWMAKESGESVILSCNDFFILVTPEDNPDTVVKLYSRANAVRNRKEDETAALSKNPRQ